MDDMLSKPYTLEACAQLLRRWLRQDGQGAAAQPSPPAPELAAMDAKAVASLRNLRSGGGADLYSKLVALFQTGSAESLAALDLALARAQAPAAAALCHKLKASAANVGALAFSRELGLLEAACDAADIEEARRRYARVRSAYPALLTELGALAMRASA
jgi:HPt (histidine-containing phosphotransfer) domain-containing protein